jgi:hypothetical protein
MASGISRINRSRVRSSYAARTVPAPLLFAQQVRLEAAAAKTQNCEKAKLAYDKAVQALRIYKTDDKGNRTYLTADELDAARLQARSARDLACGS